MANHFKNEELLPQDYKEIEKIARAMRAQSNHGTAAPYIICLQELREEITDERVCSEHERYYDSEGACEYQSLEQLTERMYEMYGCQNAPKAPDLTGLDEESALEAKEAYEEELAEFTTAREKADERIKNCEKLYVKKEWHDVAHFFTFRGGQEHLELNAHNYRKETRFYIKHCFRNPEMALIQKLVLNQAKPSKLERGLALAKDFFSFKRKAHAPHR